MPIMPPSVPYTPHYFSALPEVSRVSFFYRLDEKTYDEFCKWFATFQKGQQHAAAAESLASATTDFDGYAAGQGPPVEVLRGRAAAGLRVESAKAKIEAFLKAGVLPLTLSQQYDELTGALGRVVQHMTQGNSSESWPVDFDAARKMVGSFPLIVWLQLSSAIVMQSFDAEMLKKS